jgi:hypothetical protein
MTPHRFGWRSVAAAAVLMPAIASAQRGATPAPAVAQSARAAVLLPDGAYLLTMTPATGDSRAFTTAAPIQIAAQAVHSGMETTITTNDGVVLRGASSATHLKASGPGHGARLTLELGGSGTEASGTWLLRGQGAHQVTGTVTVAPAPRYQTRTSKQGGCSGFFDCLTQVTGYAWKTIFG